MTEFESPDGEIFYVSARFITMISQTTASVDAGPICDLWIHGDRGPVEVVGEVGQLQAYITDSCDREFK